MVRSNPLFKENQERKSIKMAVKKDSKPKHIDLTADCCSFFPHRKYSAMHAHGSARMGNDHTGDWLFVKGGVICTMGKFTFKMSWVARLYIIEGLCLNHPVKGGQINNWKSLAWEKKLFSTHYCLKITFQSKAKNNMKDSWGATAVFVGAFIVHSDQGRAASKKNKKTPHIWMLKKQSCSKHAKGRKLFSFHAVGAVFGSIQQGVKLLFNTTSADILPLPAPRRTYLNTVFPLLFSQGGQRHPGSPHHFSGPRQPGSSRTVANRALCIAPPPWVGVGLWVLEKEWNVGRKSWHFRAIETDCKMHDGEGEAHYGSFIFGSEATDAEMRVYRKTYFQKWQSFTLQHSDQWHLPVLLVALTTT